MEIETNTLRHNLLRNAIYHSGRRRLYEALNRWFNFLVIILGTGVIGSQLTESHVNPIWVGAAVSIIGALQLVFDFSGSARDHQSLQKRYYGLLAEVEKSANITPEMIRHWQSEMTIVFTDEPPIYRAEDAMAYNEALDALGIFDADQERLIIPKSHWLAANWLRFPGYHYKKQSEIDSQTKLS